MEKDVIVIKDLKKEYKTHKRKEGILNAVKSLFCREYEYKKALKGISFTVKKGEILGLIGPNGAGKSTTIKALSGVLIPSSGEINVLGFEPWKDRIKYVNHLGVVFGQKEQLWWDLPAVDTFYLSKALYKIDEKVFERKLKYMTKLLDVEEVMHTPVRDMSLGERMKCKLIAALLHNPELVLLDEPSIGLDVIAKDRFRDFIKRINKKYGTTFIITTHDMQEIEQLCKNIIIINHGKIIYDGPLKDIKANYLPTKLMDIKLGSKGKKFKMGHCEVLEQSEYEIKIKIDTRKRKIRDIINHVMVNYNVADIIISDPPIEEIIQIIFKEKNE